MTDAPLLRRIGPGLLTAYGVGVMIGAGIYVLVGAVAADAGVWAPLSFLIAGVIAVPTALSYAEFSSRLPEAAGEAAYIGAGFGKPALAMFVGLAIVVAGTVSAAAVLRGGVAYLTNAIDIPTVIAILFLGLCLTAVAIWGVLESLALAALFTAVELAGLVLVAWAGFGAEPVAAWTTPPAVPMSGLLLGAALAFFAFIGFEDIVNMAEEVREPERTLPIAILSALAITTVIYALVTLAAVRAVPGALLAASESPLALVWQARFGGTAGFLSLVAVFAALNGVLAQIVMASRVLFGLGARSPAFALFHKAHPRLGTPLLATALVGGCVIGAAVALPVATLAEATAAILLAVFTFVNLALIRLKRADPAAQPRFEVPLAVPVAGFVLSAAALAITIGDAL